MRIEFGERGFKLPREFDLPHVRLVPGRGRNLSEICEVDYRNSLINGIHLPLPRFKITRSRRTGSIYMGSGSVGEDRGCCSLFSRGDLNIRAFQIHIFEELGLSTVVERALQLIIDSNGYSGWSMGSNPQPNILPVSVSDKEYIKNQTMKGMILFPPVENWHGIL